MSELFLCEWPFPLEFEGDSMVVEYQVAHPKAKIDDVITIKEYNLLGHPTGEKGFLLVKDLGDTSKLQKRRAIVVRRKNELTPLPEECGKLVRTIHCYGGRWTYYVFDGKELPSRRNTSEETTPPSPEKSEDTQAGVSAAPPGESKTNVASHASDTTSPDTDAWSGW